MKRILSFLTGMAFVLVCGMASGDDMRAVNSDTGDKVIRDNDLLKYDQDQGQGTLSQFPALPWEKGSGAGGSSGDSDSTWKSDTPDKPGSVEKDMKNPTDSGHGKGEPSEEKDTYPSY